MLRLFGIAVAALLLVPTTLPTTAEAGAKGKSRYSKSGGSQVRGYRTRRGSYSYSANDVANTAGDSRTRYGSVNSYRDPFSDRQTVSGPFDHGWFFDSAIAPRGGDSPYMQ
ncbi:MAG: hypothetical protein JXQ99_01250 [Hyphomicrobiaceae bacterium]